MSIFADFKKHVSQVKSSLQTKRGANISIIILSLLITLFIDRSELLHDVIRGNIGFINNTPYILCSLCIFCSFWFTCLQLARRSKVFAYIIFPIISLIQFTIYYGETRYGAELEELTVAILNTTATEAGNYVNLRSSALFLFFIITVTFGVYIFRKLYAINRSTISHIFFHLLTIGTLFIIPHTIKLTAPSLAAYSVKPIIEKHPHYLYMPTVRSEHEVTHSLINDDTQHNCFYKMYQPIRKTELFIKAITSYYNPPQLINSATISSHRTWESCDESIVLYIGESFRADHSPMNGYSRNTLPLLSKETNIINLQNMHSDATHTIASVYSLLTTSLGNRAQPTHTSFIDIFNKHNYKSVLVVGKNTEGQWYNTPLISPILREQAPLYSRPASPNEYKETIATILRTHKGSKFILMEDGAGHMPYNSTSTPFGTSRSIDKYDNAILDIDATVHAVIESLKSSSAIMIFTSDHGESFGEHGRHGHGGASTAKEQTHVCAFIWYSDAYATQHPEVINALRANAARFTTFEHIYHTIISMGGIASDIQVPELDMTIAPSDGSDN